MENGTILIDKPAGMTSFGVVARIKRVLTKEAGKKVKVGHTGTLDPFASGLMILVIGKECKNAGEYLKLDKEYETEIILGKNSTTGDPEGEITDQSDRQPTLDEVNETIQKFTGKIKQQPPIFSAIKINGRRAYDLARKGEKIEMPTREVQVYAMEVVEYNYPVLKVRAKVSSGTYIRTLASDIGKDLGVGAYCINLRRLSIADWHVDSAKKLVDFGIVD